MGNSLLFGFGVFVVLIFLIGILFTIKEFQNMDDGKQRNYQEDSNSIRINQ